MTGPTYEKILMASRFLGKNKFKLINHETLEVTEIKGSLSKRLQKDKQKPILKIDDMIQSKSMLKFENGKLVRGEPKKHIYKLIKKK